MFIVVCYDMPDNRKRNKASKILEGFGARVQKSVFECVLSAKEFEKLKERLSKVLTEDDGLRYYLICAECLPRIEVKYGLPVTKIDDYFVV